MLAYQFCEYLIDVSNTNALMPKLATSWTPNAKGDVWTFHLRQGVKFNDGSPFEAADVVASIERVLIPETARAPSRPSPASSRRAAPRPLDTYTVQFNLEKPFADFPYLVSSSSYNTAMLPAYLQRHRHFPRTAIGTGPWMLKNFMVNQSCNVVKNPHYWGKDSAQGRQLPYLTSSTITCHLHLAAVLQLQSGAVDVQPQTVFSGRGVGVQRLPTSGSTYTPRPASARSLSTSTSPHGRT